MKVLLSAYSCRPSVGSERGTGWEYARAAALQHEVWVLTRPSNRPFIEAALVNEPGLTLHPVYVDPPRWLTFWKRGERGLYPFYLLWQLVARRRGIELHQIIEFDVAHHVTMALDWLPAGVSFIPAIPHVWGPVGGATVPPLALIQTVPWRRRFGEVGRAVVGRVGRAMFGRPTAKRSALVVANNFDEVRAFEACAPVIVDVHAALVDLPTTSTQFRGADGRRAVAACRLIHWKGIHLAVAALACPEADGWRFDIYGDGPEKEALKILAAKFGVGDRVDFHGRVPRQDVLRAFVEADALLQPSMHDGGGWVYCESVALGLPVVALKLGGPAAIVRPGEGVLVEPGRAVVRDLARALGGLGPRNVGSDRWAADRLPALLDSWYRRAAPDACD